MSPRARIGLNEEMDPVRIPGRILNEICAHARETQPEECCGLVSGSRNARFEAVYRCRNDMTLHHRNHSESFPRDGRHAYYMNEIDYLKAQRDAESRGERVTAVYHSHVEAGAYFSEMDQEFAEHALFPFPQAAQIVVALWDGKVSGLGYFEFDERLGSFVGRAVEAGPAK